MNRWLAVLMFLSVLTGLLTFGIIPTSAVGLARILFFTFSAMLAGSLLIAVLRTG